MERVDAILFSEEPFESVKLHCEDGDWIRMIKVLFVRSSYFRETQRSPVLLS